MDQIIQFQRSLQGLASSPFHAQSAMKLTFAQVVFDEWREKKGLKKEQFPYQNYLEFLSFFLGDVLIYTDEKFGVDIHLLALDACFYGISRAGWVTNLKKCKFLTDRIKFLGVDLNAREATAEIHADRAKAILEMRQPRSTAEASSRASLVLFCAPFLPCLKKLLLPILKMVQSGEFKWEQCHARSYSEIKMLISLNIKNTIFDPTKTLILETDASKMACSAVIWQLDDHGQMQLLSTASSVLSTAQMRSPSVIRE